MAGNSRRLAIATLLGIVAFLSKAVLPTPVDKMFVVVQALTFALASLLIGGWGATYASIVNGSLLGIVRPGFFPFSLVFSLIYGILVDVFIRIFKVKMDGQIKTVRLTISLVLSTAIIGLITIQITTMLGLMPMIPILYLIIFIIGVLNGIVAGYLTSLVWNKHLARHFKS